MGLGVAWLQDLPPPSVKFRPVPLDRVRCYTGSTKANKDFEALRRTDSSQTLL